MLSNDTTNDHHHDDHRLDITRETAAALGHDELKAAPKNRSR